MVYVPFEVGLRFCVGPKLNVIDPRIGYLIEVYFFSREIETKFESLTY
jgi:hypothetical protein